MLNFCVGSWLLDFLADWLPGNDTSNKVIYLSSKYFRVYFLHLFVNTRTNPTYEGIGEGWYIVSKKDIENWAE